VTNKQRAGTSAGNLDLLDRYWRAANYLSVGQIYLLDNPLLREPLLPEHIKPRLLGHWGTTPGLNFIYAHLNRAIRTLDLEVLYVCGPGHGGPGMVANTYLEGSYSEIYPDISRDAHGMRKLFRQFSFPGGIPSHAAPETPGSIHEGGELGYALVHAYGAALDNPDLVVACVVGDGEAETGPLAASWHSNKFLNPANDGAVLPILHLNGYKIANPTVLGRMRDEEIRDLFRGYGHEPLFVEGDDPMTMHRIMADALDVALASIRSIQHHAREARTTIERPRWPMIVHGDRRMGANPHANGGLLKRELKLPDFRSFAVEIEQPGKTVAEATRELGKFLRDVVRLNADARNFRIMGPDETASNRLDAVFEATNRTWMEPTEPYDVHLAQDGRVMEVLSEHLCQGWLEGYLLTGRHGFFSCYEAFIHIVDSMFNQHAKWLKVSRELAWRRPIASLNYLLTSHVWRQDHNGFSHQDPGFVDLVTNKKADIVRVYLPPDANTLLWVADHCLRTYDRINVIVAGKQPAPQWLTMQDAATHCDAGIGIWTWAGTEKADVEPDVVMACAGDVPTVETLAAVDLLRKALPDLKIRVVNVVDLMTLQPKEQHPHGLSDRDFDSLFTRDKPVIFAYHGYPYLIHRLTYSRTNHAGMHVRGFAEEGTTTTPFDMVVLNGLDRYHLAIEAIERVPGLATKAAHVKQQFRDTLIEHARYVREHGEDMPMIRNWVWPDSAGGHRAGSSSPG